MSHVTRITYVNRIPHLLTQVHEAGQDMADCDRLTPTGRARWRDQMLRRYVLMDSIVQELDRRLAAGTYTFVDTTPTED